MPLPPRRSIERSWDEAIRRRCPGKKGAMTICGKLTPAGRAGALPLRGPISLTIALPGSCQEPIVQLKEQSLAWVT